MWQRARCLRRSSGRTFQTATDCTIWQTHSMHQWKQMGQRPLGIICEATGWTVGEQVPTWTPCWCVAKSTHAGEWPLVLEMGLQPNLSLLCFSEDRARGVTRGWASVLRNVPCKVKACSFLLQPTLWKAEGSSVRLREWSYLGICCHRRVTFIV